MKWVIPYQALGMFDTPFKSDTWTCDGTGMLPIDENTY